MLNHHLVVSVIRNHCKQLTLETFWTTNWDQHVIWPTTTAEIELSQIVTASWSIRIQIPESSIERNCDG